MAAAPLLWSPLSRTPPLPQSTAPPLPSAISPLSHPPPFKSASLFAGHGALSYLCSFGCFVPEAHPESFEKGAQMIICHNCKILAFNDVITANRCIIHLFQ
ncbi:hypothetical protein GOODEAATRI_030953 [Goodea atripinnis]|uniref:Uncharacterized protein n=1 Tax=Goodea atripinnis TaxID=208336 RepID=A0ABV0Q2I0_9TELE